MEELPIMPTGGDAGQEEPGAGAAPKKKKKGTIITIVAAVIVVMVILALFFVVLPEYNHNAKNNTNSTNYGIAGVWHITEWVCCGNTTSVDEYMAFYPNGTFVGMDNSTGQKNMGVWKDIGNSQVRISEGSLSFNFTYAVNDNHINLTGTNYGKTYSLCGVRVKSLPSQHTVGIDSWTIIIDGVETKVIHATPQTDGTAKWSGTVTISVKDQNGHGLSDVEVSVSGCGVYEELLTGWNGTVTFHLYDVTLQSGVQTDEINVTMTYGGQEKYDTITVVRAS